MTAQCFSGKSEKPNSGGIHLKLYHTLQKGLHLFQHRRTAALIAALIMLLTATAATEYAAALYILTGAESSAIILDGSTTVPEISSAMVNLSARTRSTDITLYPGQSVRIIHGKGTGALRTAVQQSLRKNKFIKSFRVGVYGEGEDGVTIAEFK